MSTGTVDGHNWNDEAEPTQLARDISPSETSIEVGALNSTPAIKYYALISVTGGKREILEVTGESSNPPTLAVNRGQKGTSAKSFSQGDSVFLGVIPADALNGLSSEIITAQGEIIAGDSNGSPSAVPAGSPDDVLKMDGSGNPVFGPSPAGGAWTKITTTVISSATAEIIFESGISGDTLYAFVFNNVTNDSSNTYSRDIFFRVTKNGSAVRSDYILNRFGHNGGGVASSYQGGEIKINTLKAQPEPNSSSGVLFASGFGNTNAYVSVNYRGNVEGDDSGVYIGSGAYKVRESVDGVSFILRSGNFNSGKITLYEIAQ